MVMAASLWVEFSPGEGFLKWKLGCQEPQPPCHPGGLMAILFSNVGIGGLQQGRHGWSSVHRSARDLT